MSVVVYIMQIYANLDANEKQLFYGAHRPDAKFADNREWCFLHSVLNDHGITPIVYVEKNTQR